MRESIWFKTLSGEQSALLEASDDLPASADVVVVGAGLIGLSTAYYLTRAGVSNVCVIDRGPILGEAGGANAGGLWYSQQSLEMGPLTELGRVSRALYRELAEELDFDLTTSGMLDLIETNAGAQEAERRLAAMQAAGYRGEILSAEDVRKLEPGLNVPERGAMWSPEDGHLHPAKLAAGFLRLLRQAGVRICANAEATDLRDGVTTSRGKIAAGTVILTTGAWTPLVTAQLGWRPPIRPIRGTLLALPKSAAGTIRHTVMTRRYYFWQLAEGPLAAGGSEDDLGFERGVDPATVADIRDQLASLFPGLADQPTLCSWSGFRPRCEGFLPVIGAVPHTSGTYVAAGHFKKGVMLAPITGKIMAELVTEGRTGLDIEALRPDRFPSAA